MYSYIISNALILALKLSKQTQSGFAQKKSAGTFCYTRVKWISQDRPPLKTKKKGKNKRKKEKIKEKVHRKSKNYSKN